MIRPIIEYAEQSVFFYQDEYPSITALPTTTYIPEIKEKILDYLTNRKFNHIAVPAISGVDAFTGKQFHALGEMFTDGEYGWYDSLSEYVRLHDIELPEEFIEHVIRQSMQE